MRHLAVALSLCVAAPAFADEAMEARDIIARAHEAAGGETWVNPQTLYMEGHGVFFPDGGHQAVIYEPYRMWRVYPEGKDDAHIADGRVRIDAFREGETVFQLAFDGTHTYNQNGLVPGGSASPEWSNSFGFGAIRYALDPDYSLHRLPDDYVDGREVHVIRVTDVAGGDTVFSIAQDDFAILRVGFQTPRGWHERIYSDFFSNEGDAWVQPGRVRLFYNGVKANETIWTAYRINAPMDDQLFVLGE